MENGATITVPLEMCLKITDERDIAEIERRKKITNGKQPPKEELYTFNPNFDGNYSDLSIFNV